MTGVVLGVDLGTTATKVVATRLDGRVVATAEQGYPLELGEHGEAVQDPQVVLAAATHALADCVHRVDGEIKALSFSSAMHTLLALDATLGFEPVDSATLYRLPADLSSRSRTDLP